MAAICLLAALGGSFHASAQISVSAPGTRTESFSSLKLPSRADGPMPQRLSQTGAFKTLANVVPSEGLIPYDLIVPFWSDGAEKSRWISVPPGKKINFAATGEWVFPPGTVFVKEFDLATDEMNPAIKRRLETRFIVCDETGGVYGVTYKWRADNSDADLLTTNLNEDVAIHTATGTRNQTWYYPSQQDCLTCHTANAGLVLGVKTRQLNRDLAYPGGDTENELCHWLRLGLFDTNFTAADVKNFPKLAARDDLTRSVEDRARSYLDANCAHCHRPKGTVAYFDARYDTPLAQQGLVGGRVLIDERVDGARVIAPNDLWRSILFMRTDTVDAFKMPPLARNAIDTHGMELLQQWIESLPGPRVLAPPEISPHGGNFTNAVTVTLTSEPGATIRYTVDGTVPTTADFLYEKPIEVSSATILRAKAFKPGATKSITAREIFLFGQ